MQIEVLFRNGFGYDDLIAKMNSNSKFIFYVLKTDSTDKRTKKAKVKGWTKVAHKKYGGDITIRKDNGRCSVEIDDKSESQQLSGAWINWLRNQTQDLIFGMDIRFC